MISYLRDVDPVLNLAQDPDYRLVRGRSQFERPVVEAGVLVHAGSSGSMALELHRLRCRRRVVEAG